MLTDNKKEIQQEEFLQTLSIKTMQKDLAMLRQANTSENPATAKAGAISKKERFTVAITNKSERKNITPKKNVEAPAVLLRPVVIGNAKPEITKEVLRPALATSEKNRVEIPNNPDISDIKKETPEKPDPTPLEITTKKTYQEYIPTKEIPIAKIRKEIPPLKKPPVFQAPDTQTKARTIPTDQPQEIFSTPPLEKAYLQDVSPATKVKLETMERQEQQQQRKFMEDVETWAASTKKPQ